MRDGSRAWAGLAALLCVLAIAARAVPAGAIDWQPALAMSEPWRAFSAAALHYSTLHLGANLLGAVLVGALGVVADVPRRLVWAWFAAWPLTQLGLLMQPALLHFGGLSGVLHAGTAVVATHLLLAEHGRRRAIGAAILGCVVVKVASEAPWGEPLRQLPQWDIAVAPLAHATGTLAGVFCAALAQLMPSNRGPGRA